MKKWKASFGYVLDVKEYEVVKETEKTVTIKSVNSWSEKTVELREFKNARGHSYHDTFEEAHALVLERAREKVAQAKNQFQRARDEYGNIKGMKSPAE